MKFRSIALGSLLTAAFLMISGADCPGRSPLAQGIDGGTTPPTLNWNLIGGGNRTLGQDENFSITNEIVITDSYAGDRSTYDLSFSGIPSTWEPDLNVDSITCPPLLASPIKSSSGCVFTLSGITPSSAASGEFPYTIRAQRRGTNEAQTVTGVLTVQAPAGPNFGIALFSIPDDTVQQFGSGSFDNNGASYTFELTTDASFSGNVVLVASNFANQDVQSKMSRNFEDTVIDFGPDTPVSDGRKRREIRLNMLRTAGLNNIGTFPFTIVVQVQGQSQQFTLNGSNLIVEPVDSGGD